MKYAFDSGSRRYLRAVSEPFRFSELIYMNLQLYHPDNPRRGRGITILCPFFHYGRRGCRECPFYTGCGDWDQYWRYAPNESVRSMDVMYNKLVELYELELAKEATS